MKDKRQLFEEIESHLMEDDKPSEYLESLKRREGSKKEHPFQMLYDLQYIGQSPMHHPEGNVWNHTMMVVDQAAICRGKSSDPRAFMWGALLHDLGKAVTTKIMNKKIVSYEHEKVGAAMAQEFMKAICGEEDLARKVSKLVLYHMELFFATKKLPYSRLQEMMEEAPYKEVGLLALCDRLGRGHMNEVSVKDEMENFNLFQEICEKTLERINAHKV